MPGLSLSKPLDKSTHYRRQAASVVVVYRVRQLPLLRGDKVIFDKSGKGLEPGAENGGTMTVKDLKEKLEKLPDNADVRFVTDSKDNLTQDFYDAEFVFYLELMQKDGVKAVYIAP